MSKFEEGQRAVIINPEAEQYLDRGTVTGVWFSGIFGVQVRLDEESEDLAFGEEELEALPVPKP